MIEDLVHHLVRLGNLTQGASYPALGIAYSGLEAMRRPSIPMDPPQLLAYPP